MTYHHQDRKLVKQPKPVRFDDYQEQMILAIANWEGMDFSKAVRALIDEAIHNRMDMIIKHKKMVAEQAVS